MRTALLGCFLAVSVVGVLVPGCKLAEASHSGPQPSVVVAVDLPPDPGHQLILDLLEVDGRVLLEEQETSTLISKAKFTRVIPLSDTALDASIVYQVSARSLGDGERRLRIQAVWFAEGGWDATDSAGDSLTRIHIEHVKPEEAAVGNYALKLERPPAAVELRIYLINEGTADLEVTRVLVIEESVSAPASTTA